MSEDTIRNLVELLVDATISRVDLADYVREEIDRAIANPTGMHPSYARGRAEAFADVLAMLEEGPDDEIYRGMARSSAGAETAARS